MPDQTEDIADFLTKINTLIEHGNEQLGTAHELLNNLGATATELGGGVAVTLSASGDMTGLHIDEFAYKKGPERLATAIKSAYDKARTVVQNQTQEILLTLIDNEDISPLSKKYLPDSATSLEQESRATEQQSRATKNPFIFPNHTSNFLGGTERKKDYSQWNTDDEFEDP